MPNYEQRAHFIINIVFVGLIAAIIFVVLRLVAPCTLPFLMGLAIAFLLKPITAFITRHTSLRRKAVSIAVIALFYVLVTSLLATLAALVFTQLGKLLGSLPELYSQGLGPILAELNSLVFITLNKLIPGAAGQLGQFLDVILETMSNAVDDLSASAAQWLAQAVKGLPMFFTTLLFTVISSILISVDYSTVTSFLLRQMPMKYRHMLLDAKDFMVGSLFKMLKAYMIIMIITMVELSLGLWALGVELALAIGIIIAMLDILPLIGTGGVLIPWGLIELIRGNYFLGGGLLALFAVVTVIRNIIEPKIVGKQIGLHPVVTIAAMYLGLRLFGFLGLVFAPLTALLVKYLNDSGKIHIYE